MVNRRNGADFGGIFAASPAATALITLLILLAYGLAGLNLTEMYELFTERLEDVPLRSGLAVTGTVAAFPRDVPDQD